MLFTSKKTTNRAPARPKQQAKIKTASSSLSSYSTSFPSIFAAFSLFKRDSFCSQKAQVCTAPIASSHARQLKERNFLIRADIERPHTVSLPNASSRSLQAEGVHGESVTTFSLHSSEWFPRMFCVQASVLFTPFSSTKFATDKVSYLSRPTS